MKSHEVMMLFNLFPPFSPHFPAPIVKSSQPTVVSFGLPGLIFFRSACVRGNVMMNLDGVILASDVNDRPLCLLEIEFGILSRSRVRSKSGGTFHTSYSAATCPRIYTRRHRRLGLVLLCMLRMLRLRLSSLPLHPHSPIAFPDSKFPTFKLRSSNLKSMRNAGYLPCLKASTL